MRELTIIGGGLAGLTLGIALRQYGVPVVVREAGRYPRHRVCGEFISGRGQQVLVNLGLGESLERAGVLRAETARFFLGANRSPIRQLRPPALCISRFTLDALLARTFRERGGDLRERNRARASEPCEGIVLATGRRSQAVVGRWRWFGLKIHARGVELDAALEMHGQPDGYVGLCRLSDGMVNICGLFRRRAGARDAELNPRQLLRGAPGTQLRERLGQADFEEDSLCSVAGLCLRPQRSAGRPECCLGDALTMIPPVTGNGMSMAFEAAGLAVGPLVAWSRGELGWDQARHAAAAACDRAFGQRLRWSRCLQWMMFAPLIRGRLGGVALHSEWFWQLMFRRTRGET